MAEKIISPGVFTNEIDQTFLPAAVADIGAALIGPTLKGPAGIPTVVTSFSDSVGVNTPVSGFKVPCPYLSVIPSRNFFSSD